MLRDEFAKAALTGLAGTKLMTEPDRCAALAYDLADAMVRRSKVPYKTMDEIADEYRALQKSPPAGPPLKTVPSWMDADELMVDPPSGWRYGFPKVWNRKTHPDMTAWLIENGYPPKAASDTNLVYRFMSVPQEANNE